jgi:hypothetical protein
MGETKAIAHRLTRETYHAPTVGGTDWQHLEVSALRDQLVTMLNGRVVSTVEGREHQAGYVGLEVVHGTLEFRRIRVTPIGATACSSKGGTPTTASGAGPEGLSPQAVKPGAGVELPKVIRQQRPVYTIEAMADKVQGAVWVDAVVLADGSRRRCVRHEITS